MVISMRSWADWPGRRGDWLRAALAETVGVLRSPPKPGRERFWARRVGARMERRRMRRRVRKCMGPRGFANGGAAASATRQAPAGASVRRNDGLGVHGRSAESTLKRELRAV